MSEEKIIRINKVLRQLNISLERAVDYLRDKGIGIEANPNTKISEEIYNILSERFAGDKGKKEASKGVSEEIKKKKDALRLQREKKLDGKRQLEEEMRQKQELIKAKAVISEPKQVGKIDWEPKATTEATSEIEVLNTKISNDVIIKEASKLIKKDMKIIAKKSRGFIGTKNGLIKPLFKIDDNSNITPIAVDEYPNGGQIFFGDYQLLDYHIKSEMFLMHNCFFISDVHGYEDRQSDPNACKKRINYNVGISSYFKKIEPNKFIPIYSNNFSLKNNEVESPENIKSDIFFLKNSSLRSLFGPFERNGKELKAVNFRYYEEEFEDYEFLTFVDKYERIFEDSTIFEILIEETSNSILRDNDGFEYLEDFKVVVDKKIGKAIDFTPLDELHKWAIDKLQQKAPKIASTLAEIKNMVSTIDSPIEKLKWEKYTKYLEEIQNDEEGIEQLVRVLKDKNHYGSDINTSNIEVLEEENRILKEDRDSKGKELADLKEQVKIKLEDLNSQLEEEKSKKQGHNSIDANKFPNLSSILNTEEKLEEVEKLLKANETFIKLNEDNTLLQARKTLLAEDIKIEEDKIRELKKAVDDIKTNFEKSATEHTVKLAEAKMYTDLLNGIDIKSKPSEKSESKKIVPQIIKAEFEPQTAKSYISEIRERLSKQGREHLTFNDVANIIITINQSFITILAGAPGVGKTSLVEKLARSYGLDDNFGYLEIPCAKGWTSSKDLIGFFNPLTNKFQPAKTKLKEALEKSSNYLNSPYIVLLDEANLSPIEHYWSDFIKLADTNYSKRIKISDNEEIKFGEGFRFIATINHDHTTETLSNRLIDRAAIIQIEKPEKVKNIKDSLDKIENIYDFNECQSLFKETAAWRADETKIRGTLNQIKSELESTGVIIVSPRKENAIIRYCEVGTGLLDIDGNSLTALDYAVSQHILPLINGRGEDFEKVLIELKEILNNKGMYKSEKLLSKIIHRGKGLKHFKYIYY